MINQPYWATQGPIRIYIYSNNPSRSKKKNNVDSGSFVVCFHSFSVDETTPPRRKLFNGNSNPTESQTA